MSITITEHDKNKVSDIFDAIKLEWEVEDEYCHDVPDGEDVPFFLSVYGEGSLCGGELEEEFTDRVARAIWQANGGYCRVEVKATYLEDLPYETDIRDEEDYKDWEVTNE